MPEVFDQKVQIPHFESILSVALKRNSLKHLDKIFQGVKV